MKATGLYRLNWNVCTIATRFHLGISSILSGLIWPNPTHPLYAFHDMEKSHFRKVCLSICWYCCSDSFWSSSLNFSGVFPSVQSYPELHLFIFSSLPLPNSHGFHFFPYQVLYCSKSQEFLRSLWLFSLGYLSMYYVSVWDKGGRVKHQTHTHTESKSSIYKFNPHFSKHFVMHTLVSLAVTEVSSGGCQLLP